MDSGGVPLSPARLTLTIRLLGFRCLPSSAGLRSPAPSRGAGSCGERALQIFFVDPDALDGEFAARVLPSAGGAGVADVLAGAGAALRMLWGTAAVPDRADLGRAGPKPPAQRRPGDGRRCALPRLDVIERVGHCPMIERPAEFDRLIGRFGAECR